MKVVIKIIGQKPCNDIPDAVRFSRKPAERKMLRMLQAAWTGTGKKRIFVTSLFIYSMIFFKQCPICHSALLDGYAIDVKRDGPHMSRVRCQNCDIVFANPMADSNMLMEYYQNYYHKGNFEQLNYPALMLQKKKGVDAMSYEALCREAAFIFDYKKGGRFLDVGVGLGAILLYVDRPEFELYGTEFDADSLCFITDNFRQPVSVFQGDLLDADYPEGHFDYISCNHVIEHVLDPEAYMKEMFRILQKGGFLYLGTPNRKSNLYKLYRLSKFMRGQVPGIVDGIEHTFIFSPKNLADMAQKAGFKVTLQRRIPLRDSFKNIFGSALPLKKKIARYVQTWFTVNQELICVKPG